MIGRNDSTKAGEITERQKKNGKKKNHKMVCVQLLPLLFILINIKCVVSVRTHTFGSRLFIQHKNNDFVHSGERDQGRRKEVPAFVNANYKKSLKLPSRSILDRLRNPSKCLSPLEGSFQSVQVRRKERKGDASPLQDLNITHSSSVAVIQDEVKNVVREKGDILSNGFNERTQSRHTLGVGIDTLRGDSEDQVKHDRGREIEKGKSPKREEGQSKEISQTHTRVGSLIRRNRGPHRKKGTPQGVVDIQNTNVRSFLQGAEESRSLHLLNYIYQSWKEKNFANFVTAIKDEGFNHTCVEKWLHKMSIGLNKKYIKIYLKKDYVLIKNKYFDPNQTRVKEFHLSYEDINRCLEILIKNMGKFCSYEMSSILWAITIILIKLFKGSNSIDISGCDFYLQNKAVTTRLFHNFMKFFSLIAFHLNKVKEYLSIDESLWVIWSLCKLLHFNVLSAGGASSGGNGGIGKGRSDSSLDKSSLDKSSLDKSSLDKSSLDKSSLDKSSLDKSSLDKSSLDKSSSGDSPLGDLSTGGYVGGERLGEESPYSPHQIVYLKNKFHLTEESVKNILDIFNYIYKHLHENLQFLQEKYYIYIPFIIFESHTLLLTNSVLLLNKIISIILKRKILLSLFNFDTLKKQHRRRTLKGQHKGSSLSVSVSNRKNSYPQYMDIFKIKTLSKVYKLIKCISKIFYPLKNPNIRNLNLHNNYRNLDVALLGDFVRACNDVLVKYVDYFMFIIGYDGGEPFSVKECSSNGSDEVPKGKDRLLPHVEHLRMDHKNELIFIYNCLKSSLVSLIKLDLKDKYMYEWLNGNVHMFQFEQFPEGDHRSRGTVKGNPPMGNLQMGMPPMGNSLGSHYNDLFQSENPSGELPEEELLGEGHSFVESTTLGETNSAHPSYGESEIGDGNPHFSKDEKVNVISLVPTEVVDASIDDGHTLEGSSGPCGISPPDGKVNSNDVCLDVLALSKFTKLYSTEMKRKLIENVKRSIADSLKEFEDLYRSSDTEQVHYPTYVSSNDIYIMKEKRIEELYNEETKTFYKKKKSVKFRNIIMPKQLAIYVNYIGRNMNLVETRKQLDEIFYLSVMYMNTTRFNYCTSNDIIHFLQGLLNYFELDKKGMNALSEQVSRMLILMCTIVENSFLKWKSSNICQLIYLLTKYKHIHRNIFNKFDWLLNTIEFPYYVYEKAQVDTSGGEEVGFDEHLVENTAAQSDFSDRNAKMNSYDMEGTRSDYLDRNDVQADSAESTEILSTSPTRRTERSSKSTRISINEIKYDNLGSALWAMTSLNKHVIKKKFFLKFCYLFSVYISLHMKLYLSQMHPHGYHRNGLDGSNEQNVKREAENDDAFLQHNASYFKLPLDTMTISIYVNTFARKIKIGFKHLFDVIENDVRVVSNFSLKELSYIMYSLANVDRNALGDSIFHGKSVCHNGGDATEENKRSFERFLHGKSALWVDEMDGMFDAAQGLPPKEIPLKEIRSQEEEPTSNDALHPNGKDNGNSNDKSSDNSGNDNSGNDNSGNDNRGNDNRGNDNRGNDNRGNDNRGNDNRGNDNSGSEKDPMKGRSKTIVRKESFLRLKKERMEISSEFLNSLMEKVYNCASAILQRKKKYLQEVISDENPYMSNANKKKKIEIIDLMKLVYSIFVFLNQRIQVGRVDGIRFDLAEEIIRLYSLIVKRFPSTLNYIYLIIDTYALISNIYTLDAFTRGIIKVGSLVGHAYQRLIG
eukprot:XP_002259065.1 hypothetical protein, conserved in Plasmodium species [Plasmodium knowlesi strain H]